jgi:hypothetical protein
MYSRKKIDDHTLMASSFMHSSFVVVIEEFLEGTH